MATSVGFALGAGEPGVALVAKGEVVSAAPALDIFEALGIPPSGELEGTFDDEPPTAFLLPPPLPPLLRPLPFLPRALLGVLDPPLFPPLLHPPPPLLPAPLPPLFFGAGVRGDGLPRLPPAAACPPAAAAAPCDGAAKRLGCLPVAASLDESDALLRSLDSDGRFRR